MLSFLPSPLQGVLSFFLFFLNTLVVSVVIYLFAIFKVLAPTESIRLFWAKVLTKLAEKWISFNSFNLWLTQKIDLEIHNEAELRLDKSYLVLANHQSWTDIVILQWILNRKIPFIRFFIKKQLFWVPFLGLAWWALDFPFLNRYSREEIRKNPSLNGKDIQTAKERCARFKGLPTSILIFAEGTRWTKEKHEKSKSNYKHLLPAKSGGASAVLQVMGEQFESALDVTIYYPEGAPSFGQLFSGKLSKVIVNIKSYDLPKEINESKVQNRHVKEWMGQIWQEKDQILQELQV